jgi:hypothetical protein
VLFPSTPQDHDGEVTRFTSKQVLAVSLSGSCAGTRGGRRNRAQIGVDRVEFVTRHVPKIRPRQHSQEAELGIERIVPRSQCDLELFQGESMGFTGSIGCQIGGDHADRGRRAEGYPSGQVVGTVNLSIA